MATVAPHQLQAFFHSPPQPPIKEKGRVAQELISVPHLVGGKGEVQEVRGRRADAGCLAVLLKGRLRAQLAHLCASGELCPHAPPRLLASHKRAGASGKRDRARGQLTKPQSLGLLCSQAVTEGKIP